MKTKPIYKSGRVILPLLFIAVTLFFSGCKKELDVDASTNNQENSIYKTSKNIQFGPDIRCSGGEDPSIAINKNNRFVLVQNTWVTSYLFYQVGTVDNNAKISLGEPTTYEPYPYSIGRSPSVDINDNNIVVEAHTAERPFDGRLFYQVGYHNGSSIEWSKSYEYDDNGTTPDIAVNNNNVVVEVHNSNNSKYNLSYRVGIVDPKTKTISWGENHIYDSGYGTHPSIAINNNNQIVEVHQYNINLKLWYRVGTIHPDSKTISWGNSVCYQEIPPAQSGYSLFTPDIALSDNGFVTEVHRYIVGISNNSLWSTTGQINGDKISWYGSSKRYNEGRSPSVAANNSFIIQAHQDSGEGWTYASASKITN
ncbi:MAG: hypothetical protein ACEPOV_07590 [Hyphomicrobiales bacterium]